MRWQIHGERVVYESDWLSLNMADVEIPGVERFEHHVIRMPRQAAGVVIHDARRGVLLLWRHRFITDSWGWEVPAGAIEDGETPEEAAVREAVEETGWRPESLRPLVRFHPANGVSDQTFHVFAASRATHLGEPVDVGEAERIEWVPPARVREIVCRGDMQDGLSLTAMCFALAFDALAQ